MKRRRGGRIKGKKKQDGEGKIHRRKNKSRLTQKEKKSSETENTSQLALEYITAILFTMK
jgi:hypothetical protein